MITLFNRIICSWYATVIFAALISSVASAQVNITGRILNQSDNKPIANASVFLNNATIGSTSAADGSFILHNVRAGKYELIVSNIGFDIYRQQLVVENRDQKVSDILIFSKTTGLNEVKIKAPKEDPFWERNYNWFKEVFLGKTEFAKECVIKNPELLYLVYSDDKHQLTGTSSDFLIIENKALGYQMKYLLTDFLWDNSYVTAIKAHYEGKVLFESMDGKAEQQQEWAKNREKVYQGSMMHFLRSVIDSSVDINGFRVLQYVKKDKGSVVIDKKPLAAKDIFFQTDQKGVYLLGLNSDALHITYNKDRRFSLIPQTAHLNDEYNNNVSVIKIANPPVFFDGNGSVVNPSSISIDGAWGKGRMACLLPIDYKPLSKTTFDKLPGMKNVQDKLQAYLDRNTPEQAYLQLDKPYYAAGDTLYFKAYVTMGDGHELSQLSGLLHVELINTKNKIDKSILVKLTDGVGWGDFALSDSLPQGNYRVRAYTNWMQNENGSAIFEQRFPIFSDEGSKVATSFAAQSAPVASKSDVQFFPEGGDLVADVKSKIAFKAVGTDGLGVDVKGTVCDNAGNVMAQFTSQHLGMGSFYIKPEAGKTYTIDLTFADGAKSSVNLPPINSVGLVLNVDADNLKGVTTIAIATNQSYLQQNLNKTYHLLIYSGGAASAISFKLDSLKKSLSLANHRLHSGVNTITLFTDQGEPLQERLFSVQNFNQLKLNISSDKLLYRPRQAVSIRLQAKTNADSAAIGHYSVSVVNESMVAADDSAPNILTTTLLTSGLKGTIERPGYYFAGNDSERLQNLDLVMLTHGYRRFEWKKLLKYQDTTLAYQPEKTPVITGLAQTLKGKPLANGTVTLVSFATGVSKSTHTDVNGRFRFDDIEFADSTRFILQAVDSKGKAKTELTYTLNYGPDLLPLKILNTTKSDNPQMTAFRENKFDKNAEITKYGMSKPIMLKEVTIKNQKAKNIYASSALGGPGHADKVIHVADLPTGASLSKMLQGRLSGIRFTQSGTPVTTLPTSFGSNVVQIVVDGVPLDMKHGSTIDNYNYTDIETVEFFQYASAGIYGMRGGNGVLVLTTKQATKVQASNFTAVNILPIVAQGFYKSRAFYSPKYSTSSSLASKKKDLRTTIYWNPELTLSKSGQSVFNFYNADGKGTYRVEVEGMDENGTPGRAVFRYTVQ